jgi:histidinol-phosphate aminotransferase
MTGIPEPRQDLGLRPGYHSPQVAVEVRLNTNESPVPPPPAFVEALIDEVRQISFHRYPDRGAWELRKALGEWHEVRPEQVFCANGSNEVLQTVCLAYGGATRRALTFEPTYALHSHIAHVTGTEVIEIDRRADFTIDTAGISPALGEAQPAITFLCSPNNPTGMIEDPGTVDAVLAAAPGLVVVDEAYGQFANWSAIPLVAEGRPLVVTRTFSKTWSMAAMRLGYLIGPASVVETLERVALPYHLDSVKQAAGRLALRFTDEMEERIGLLVRERGRVVSALADLGVTTWPSQANFILWRPQHRSGPDTWRELVERSVLVRDCSSWPRLSGCLRVTVGTEADNDRFVAALTEVLGS